MKAIKKKRKFRAKIMVDWCFILDVEETDAESAERMAVAIFKESKSLRDLPEQVIWFEWNFSHVKIEE